MLYSEVFPEELERYKGKAVAMRKVDGDNFEIGISFVKDTYANRRIVRLINRHENDYTAQFPEIINGIKIKGEIR